MAVKVGGFRSIKLRRLARLLQVPQYAAVGLLETLWFVVGSNTPGGDIGKLSDEEIEGEIGWNGDPGALVGALLDAGWLDRDATDRLVVHDWDEHAPQWVKKEQRRRVRPDTVRTLSGQHPDTVPTLSTEQASTSGKVRYGRVREGKVEVGKEEQGECEGDSVPRETTAVVGVTLQLAPIPSDFVLTEPMRALAAGAGCKSPPACFKAFHAHFRARSADHRSWSNDWPAKWEGWLANHDRYGCTGDKREPFKPPERAGTVVPSVEETRRMMREKFA